MFYVVVIMILLAVIQGLPLVQKKMWPELVAFFWALGGGIFVCSAVSQWGVYLQSVRDLTFFFSSSKGVVIDE